MKNTTLKFIVLSLSTALFVQNALGSPLVFKTSAKIETDKLTEIALFDATKYQKIRIGVIFDPLDNLTTSEKDLLQRKQTLLQDGLISKLDFDSYKKSLLNQRSSILNFSSVVDNDEVSLSTLTVFRSNSTVIEIPSIISIKADRIGTYKIFIWAL